MSDIQSATATTPNPKTTFTSTSTTIDDEAATEPTFDKFSKLPVELRQQIWKEALPDPRIVEIDWCHEKQQWYCPKESLSPVSGLLKANKESREVFINEYVCLPFPEGLSSHGGDTCAHNFSSSPMNYFCVKTDILYFGAASEKNIAISGSSLEVFRRAAKRSDLRQIQYLACEGQEWIDTMETELHAKSILLLFPSLKSLFLTCGDIDFTEFDATKSRTQGEVKFVSLHTFDRGSSRIQYLRRIFNGLVTDGLVLSNTPEPEYRRVTRGGVLMKHNCCSRAT